MAYEFYLSAEGTKQGKYKGNSKRDKWKEKIECLAWEYEVESPRDVATGAASGKRQHKPLKVWMQSGVQSPLFFNSAVTNEVLKKVTLEFVKTSEEGAELVWMTITLTNATVSKFDMSAGVLDYAFAHTGDDTGGRVDYTQLDGVSLTFQRIEIEDKEGKTMGSDDWRMSK